MEPVMVMQRNEAEQRAAAMIAKAKSQIMMNHPLWAALLMRLRVRQDWRAKTLYTDGRVLGYNPLFVLSKTLDDIIYIEVHEVSHCALGHPMRTRDKTTAEEREDWNKACDHAVNLLLNRDTRLKMPSDGLADPKYAGLNADVIYRHIRAARAKREAEEQQQQQQQSQSQGGDSNDDDGSGATQKQGTQAQPEQDEQQKPQPDEAVGSGTLGDVIAPHEAPMPGDDEPSLFADDDEENAEDEEVAGDASDDEEDDDEVETAAGAEDEDDEEDAEAATHDAASDAELEREWQEALSSAAVAGGAHSEMLERSIREATVHRQSFAEVLEHFLNQSVKQYDDWGKRNRRFSDVYMPSRGGLGMQKALFIIDTSASISAQMLDMFRQVVQRVYSEASMQGAIVAYVDTAVRKVEHYSELPDFDKAPGGGCTEFAPAFLLAEELIAAGEDIACLIYLTDQENFDHAATAECAGIVPTLWVNPNVAKPAPFGVVCSLLD